MRVVEVCGGLISECARLRFELNFGGPLCENCDGLRAGPGVTATCFQVRRCDFSNLKEGDVTPKQSRVIDVFSDSKETP